MQRTPIADVEQLEDALSRPDDVLRTQLNALDGPLVVLGAGGKMGPTLARMAHRAGADVVSVSRFSDAGAREQLEAHGVRTVACDLLDRTAVDALPDAAAVLFLAGTKFGTAANPAWTWAHNALLPGLTAERYRGVATVVFSSGNVYPLVPIAGHGADESTPPAPAGEYAWSVLARERVFEYAAEAHGTPVLLYRLNYAVELRYGVLVDIALAVRDGRPIDLAMGHVNVLWQGDANRYALRALSLCAAPAAALNATGPEILSVRDLARRFGVRFGRAPELRGEEATTALLADARRAVAAFGPPTVDVDELVDQTAAWLARGGPLLGKPTHFEVRDGGY